METQRMPKSSPDVRLVRSALESTTQRTSKRLTPMQLQQLLDAIDPLVARLREFKSIRSNEYAKPERTTVKGMDPFDPELQTEVLLFPAKVGDSELKKLYRIHQQLESYSQSVSDHQRAHVLLERSRRLLQRAYTDLSSRIAVVYDPGNAPSKRSNSAPDGFAAELLYRVADTFCELNLPLVSTKNGAYYQTAAALLRLRRREIAHHRIMMAIRRAQSHADLRALAKDARARRSQREKRQ